MQDTIELSVFIFIGPGDLFTSVIPNLIVPGVKEALQRTSAKIIFIINIMIKIGETYNFCGKDFVIKLEEHLEQKVGSIVGNSTKPSQKILDLYSEQKSDFVFIDPKDSFWNDRNLHLTDLLDTNA